MENIMNLHQRVVLIAGPMSTTVASIVLSLTRLGADCVILDPDKSVLSSFINQINDGHEVNSKFGRAMVIQSDFKTAEDVKDAVGRAAQSFGGLDIFIDALMIQGPTPMSYDGSIENYDGLIDKHLKLPLMLTQNVMAYLKSRKRGRVIYLLNQSPAAKIKLDIVGAAVRSGLINFSKALARQASEFNVTVNTLSIALTEEYILAHDPDSKTIKEAMEKIKVIDPYMKVTEADKVSQTVAFIVSPMGATLNGQNFELS